MSASPRHLPTIVPRRLRLVAPASSAGFTIVEVLVASLVLTIGIVALFSNFETSQRLGTSAEAHQTAVAVAEGELERIRGLPWKEVGVRSIPSHSGETSNPAYYLVSPASAKCANKGSGAKELEDCYEWNSSETATEEPIVTGSETDNAYEDPRTMTVASVAKGSTARLTFNVYRFITWVNDGKCTASGCGGELDAKRVVVAVTGSHLNRPVTVMSIVNDSELGAKNPVKGAECVEGGEKVKCVSQE